MKILIFGAGGQLGKCFVEELRGSSFLVNSFERSDLDISSFFEVKKTILKYKPDFVINASAYTNVDASEANKEEANKINNIAVLNLAKSCAEINSTLIHFSTDYVFDGSSRVPYEEGDKTNPQCYYGMSKLNGEQAIINSKCNYLIIRTSWVFSAYGNNFLKSMIKLLPKNELSIVNDQIGAPTYAPDIAKIVLQILPQIYKKQISSLYHYTGASSCSWADFAIEIFEQLKKNSNIKKVPKIIKIKSDDYPTAANRPMFSSLNCSKIEKEFNVDLSKWKKGVTKVIKDINL